jgi:hypothetical protein
VAHFGETQGQLSKLFGERRESVGELANRRRRDALLPLPRHARIRGMNPWTLLLIAAIAGCGGAAFVSPDAAGLDTVATQDGSPESASDAPVVTNDDGGFGFVCGSVARCDGRSQVCEHVMGGAPPGVDFYECIPIPPACGS